MRRVRSERWQELVAPFPAERGAIRQRKPRRDSLAVIASYRAAVEERALAEKQVAAARRLERMFRPRSAA